MNLIAKRTNKFDGCVKCPGDKSISQRILIMGALINENLEIDNFLNGEDPLSTAQALKCIGSNIELNGTKALIKKNIYGFKNPLSDIDLGNSGTGFRLMLGFISGLGIDATLIGDKSLMQRPMERVANPLTEMGAKIKTRDDKAPVRVTANKIINDEFSYEMPISSAQVKSAILFAALSSKKAVTVIEKTTTRDHTERMIEYFGGDIATKNHKSGRIISLSKTDLRSKKKYTVAGDFSSASFLIVAALISHASHVEILNVGLNSTRIGLIEILIAMGGDISISNKKLICNELVGDIIIRSSKLKGVNVSGSIISNVIDEIPVLSIAAAFAQGKTTIKDAKELRVKESDRLEAISKGLNKISCKHKLFEDGITIYGSTDDINENVEIDSFDDHRIAMSFIIAALRSKKSIKVNNCENIKTSFPSFFETISNLGMEIDIHE